MASSEVAARLTEAHRLVQVEVSAQTTRMMARAWDALMDPLDLNRTTPDWLRLGDAIVRTQAQTSAQVSARYYMQFRSLELGQTFAAEPVVNLSAEQVATSLRVTGPVTVQRAQVSTTTERAMQIGRSMSSRSASRLALAGGRDTISGAIAGDPRCVGYARATGGLACSFCSMLASRGAVYKADTVTFRAHDGCNCTAEPRFDNGPELTPSAQRARDLWDESTVGLSGVAARNAFRRAIGR